ncbi:alpha/beta hydrolase-fold protein [Actinoplanes solisilvae]|uniref:alpha/beta hydrolase-fold protein n=1 Tax=Actinoplanes solisilvae TaxID=2486853 RepID=UPI001F0BC018|nr:alpha/beta hydrolase-fold protein [Actinoplanes solisilvae]
MLSPQIARLLDDPSSVDAFWEQVTASGTPLVEPWRDDSRLVTFLWRGQARTTRVWWGLDVELDRLTGTNLWHATRVVPSDLVTMYCLVHDGDPTLPTDDSGRGRVHIDALNPARLRFEADPADPDDNIDQWASVIALPDAPPEPWLAVRPGVPAGSLTEAPLSRPVTVYRPAGTPADGLPVLVIFDGWTARTAQHVPTILDNLIAAGEIPPVVALFIDSYAATRDALLTPGSDMGAFVTGTLLPWARESLGAGVDGRANIIAGSSRGGLAAAAIALDAPSDFGAVISQSGSFWWPEDDPGRLIRSVATRPPADLRFYLDVGTFETTGELSQVDVNRSMRDALRRHGYSVSYAEYSGGHDYVNWRRTFADGLIAVAGVHA